MPTAWLDLHTGYSIISVLSIQILEEFVFLIPHAAGFLFIARFVIIAKQVEQAVDHQVIKRFL